MKDLKTLYLNVSEGSKVEIIDPISKKKEMGTVVSTDMVFYEILLDSLRTMVIERGEFGRFSLSLLPEDTVSLSDIVLHQKDQDKKKKAKSVAWKVFERKVAEDFNTVRNALSGGWSAITNSDTLHKDLYIECKSRAEEFWFWDEFRDTQDANVGRVVVFKFSEIKKYNGELWVFDHVDLSALLAGVDIVKNDEGGLRRIITGKFRFNLQKRYGGLLSLYKQTVERATLEHKIPVVAVKMKNRKGYLLGIDPRYVSDLNKIFNKET